MRFILFILIALLSLLLQLLLPWWIIAVVAFGAALALARSGKHAFWSGFLAIALVWTGAALVIHLRNAGLLTSRIATLFFLPLPELVIAVTALIGALVGGLAALSGYYWRGILKKGAQSPSKR